MRVGVLDDDPSIRGMLQELLELAGHQAVVFQDPWTLLTEQFRTDPPIPLFDVILVDMLLPGVTGSEVIHHLQQVFATLPIIVISALPSESLLRFSESHPTIRVLRKPFSLPELLAAIEAEVSS